MGQSDTEISNRLQQLTGIEFENFVADLWESRGWETRVTKGSGDEGIDVIAEKSNPFPERVLIQTKRYKPGQKVSPREVREYNSTRDQRDNVDKVIIVTTSGFTQQAKKTADDLNVKLINGHSLAQLISEWDCEAIVNHYTSDPDSSVKRPDEDSLDSPYETSSNRSVPSNPSASSDILRVEMTGLRWSNTKLETDPETTFLGESPGEFEGYVATFEIYNKTDKPHYIQYRDEVEIVSREGEIFHPVQLTPDSVPDGWESLGGGFGEGNRDYAVHIPPSGKVRFLAGVSMPRSLDVYAIIIEKFDIGIELEKEMYQPLSNLSNAVNEVLQ